MIPFQGAEKGRMQEKFFFLGEISSYLSSDLRQVPVAGRPFDRDRRVKDIVKRQRAHVSDKDGSGLSEQVDCFLNYIDQVRFTREILNDGVHNHGVDAFL